MKTKMHSFVAAVLFGLFAGGPVALASDGTDDGMGTSSGIAAEADSLLASLLALFGADEKISDDYPTPSVGGGSENPIIRTPT